MKTEVEIRRYRIKKTPFLDTAIISFFENPKWEKKPKDGLYCLRRTSIYFLIGGDKNEAFVDVWSEGPFGVVFPLKGRLIGFLDLRIVNNIMREFEEYLRLHRIEFYIDVTRIVGKSQLNTLLYVIVIPLVIAILWLTFSRT